VRPIAAQPIAVLFRLTPPLALWAALAGLHGAAAQTPAPPSPPAPTAQMAVLQGLDKVTARISTLNAPLGQAVRFGTLEIVVRTCRTRPPEEPPETTAFLEIVEARRGEAPARLFTGWMFASSPALNPLEHPVYDVWVIDCKTVAPGVPLPVPNPSRQ
jgi:hypothetical protein